MEALFALADAARRVDAMETGEDEMAFDRLVLDQLRLHGVLR